MPKRARPATDADDQRLRALCLSIAAIKRFKIHDNVKDTMFYI